MKSVNRVFLIGNLGGDVNQKFTPQGTSVAVFSMATNEQWKDKTTKEKKTRTDWHRVVCWRGLADVAAKYLAKGDPVHVEGQLSQRSYEDKETGKTIYVTEVVATDLVLLGGKGEGVERPGDGAPEITDEDIPF